MSLENGDNTPTDGGNEEQAITIRSERKRQREKQRRSDLSNAFDELAAFIVQVEPESGDPPGADANKKRKKSDRGEDASGITRLELIARALRIMRRLHTENEERKRKIAIFQEKGGAMANDNVLVMVPTLAPAGDEPYPVARASYPPYAGYPPPYYRVSHHQAHPVPDYGQQVPAGRGPSPQHHPQWGGYHDRGAPPVMSPHNAPPPPPPPYGTPSAQHQEHASHPGSPRPALE